MKKLICLLPLLSLTWLTAQTTLPLTNMSAFRSQAGNWQIVGQVQMDRNIDIHDEHVPEQPVEPVRKKKNKKKTQSTVELKPRKAVTSQTGSGILLNLNEEGKKDNLITAFEHGDIELELDVMLPKSSNSGIYLQGRYEVQLYDSWGVKHPGFSDIGGIFRNWESAPGKKLQGIPPSSNPSKAPGLWQHMKISFRAPRFDAEGNKLSNALFEYVELNGVRIHDHVEVALPTGGPIAHDEVPMGPLMIQGDHGPVAFRNIRYNLLSPSQARLCELTYKSYHHSFTNLEDFQTLSAVDSGRLEQIQVQVADAEDRYGISFDGKIIIPEEDEYQFTIGYSGGFRFIFNGEMLAEENVGDRQGKKTASVNLKKGTYPFQLLNMKNAGWRSPMLGLEVQTASTLPQKFHTYASFPETSNMSNPILENPGAKPRMLRAFVNYQNEAPTLTQTIGLGFPGGINYVYDMTSAQLVGLWRGDFVDATPMWHNRGNGSFKPNGAVLWRFLGQPLAVLADLETPFPAYSTQGIVQKGYRIDPVSQHPIFLHAYEGMEIETQIDPDPNQNFLIQQMTFSGEMVDSCYLKLAEGAVQELADGSFLIGDQAYYIHLLTEQKTMIREVEGKTELILAVDGEPVRFEIIW
jgi:hypothetical protein